MKTQGGWRLLALLGSLSACSGPASTTGGSSSGGSSGGRSTTSGSTGGTTGSSGSTGRASSGGSGSTGQSSTGASGSTGGSSSGSTTSSSGGSGTTGGSTGIASPFSNLALVAGQAGGPGNLDGTGAAACFNYPAGVANDGAGNLYVADTGNLAVRKIVLATGAVTTVVSDLPGQPLGVAVDASGHLYVSATDDTIRQVDLATGAVSILAGASYLTGTSDGTGTNARFDNPAGLVLDDAGNLYVADSDNNTIREVVLVSGAVTTLAGSAGVRGSQDGEGTAATFDFPFGLAIDGLGNLYVADTGNETIRAIDLATMEVTTLAGSPGVVGRADDAGSAASFDKPLGLASDGAGNLFVGDTYNSLIRQLIIATETVSTLAGDYYGYADGTRSAANFAFPNGLAADEAGGLYVADQGNDAIRKVAIATAVVTTVAGSPPVLGSADDAGAAATFNAPAGIATDGVGNLYVADRDNSTIRQIVLASGTVTTLAGELYVFANADGTGVNAKFDEPTGLATDGRGNLYIGDTWNNAIRKLVRLEVDGGWTGEVTTLAGSPDGGMGNADGIGSAASFHLPEGLAADDAGNLFVADMANNTIRRIVLFEADGGPALGDVTTLAGSADGGSGSSNGTGAAASFNGPTGLATDGLGNLYVADTLNNLVRQIVISTQAVTTLAGALDPGSTDGMGTAARFYSPVGLAADGAGHLFVADTGNGTIREIDLATGQVGTVAGVPGQLGALLGPIADARLGSYLSWLAFVPGPALYLTENNAVLVLQ